MTFEIQALDSRRHIRKEFCCGNHDLDRYLKEQASQDLKRQVTTVWVLIDDPDTVVLGYYTLSAFTVDISVLDTAFAKRLPRYPQLPATLLGRLAVDRRHQGEGLGRLLLVDALERALDVSKQVASLAVIVEALDEEGVRFYRKYGFQTFQKYPMKLYLPMKTIAELF